MAGTPKPNARPGRCVSCGKDVGAGQGFAFLDPDQGWSVSCDDPACRGMCGTREAPVAPDRQVTPNEDTKLARRAQEVFDLASVALLKNSSELAFEVCRSLKDLESHYTLWSVQSVLKR